MKQVCWYDFSKMGLIVLVLSYFGIDYRLIPLLVSIMKLLLSLEIFCCDMLDCSSRGSLLLKELAFLLRGVGVEVCWITIQKPLYLVGVVYNLEHKMLNRGVQVREILHIVAFYLSMFICFFIYLFVLEQMYG